MDREKVIKGLEECSGAGKCLDCVYGKEHPALSCKALLEDVLELLKEQDSRIKKYEYLMDFLGIGFREWVTKSIDGEAEAICEVDEHKRETVIRFKHI